MTAVDFGAEVAALAAYRGARRDAVQPLTCDAADAPAEAGTRGNAGIVTRSRLHVELGGPRTRSSAFVLMTGDVRLVSDGRGWLVGPDLREVERGSQRPFGQVIVAAGAGLGPTEYEMLTECPYLADAVAGYMVRSRPGMVWGRASTDAVAAGLGFAALGSALRQIVMERLPGVTAVETLFVTSTDDDVDALAAIGERVEAKARVLHAAVWSERGVDVAAPSFVHCGSCGERDVCVGLRRIARMRSESSAGAEPACAIAEPGVAR